MKPLFLLLPLALLLGCKKDTAALANQLPPATQTGAGTFGCLVNGQPWAPNGNSGVPNFVATYDPTYLGGSLQIKTYRYTGPKQDVLQGMVFGASHVSKAGVFDIVLKGDNGANYIDNGPSAPCNYYGEPPALTYRQGTFTITRLDLQAGIVSGTFDFTLFQPGCDSVRITQGRFDKRL
ncbi:hypothetical protein [Hymenobacter nivis]|uniref:hypothetical protein n=1 Tax=Hymenobacter nivis TaxID=1850093 RepID=UPI0013A5B44D|nr:hypothetical protein [Hymenobacter nivis]